MTTCRFRTAALLALATALAPPTLAGDAAERRAAVLRSLAPSTQVEGVAWTLAERMERHRVPGIAIAVIREFQVDWVEGFGVRDAATGAPAAKDTLFQAGSISKPVAAIGALALVAAGKLELDADFAPHAGARDIFLPGVTRKTPLSLAHLLSHTGGVTVHGFLGYHRFGAVPTLEQVIDGVPPANSPPLQIDKEPGGAFRYAGGGTTLMQRAMIEVSGKPFAPLLEELVFAKVGVRDATYEQPLPEDRFPNHCAGHLADGVPTAGRYHVHPELAAAGLWISAEALAKVVIEVQLALREPTGRVIPQALARRMATPVGAGPTALGTFVETRGGSTWFQHGGANVGFRNQFYGNRDDGSGFVVLTNSDNGQALIGEVQAAIARVYGWQGFEPTVVPELPRDEAELAAAPGRYELGPDRVMVVARDGDHLVAQVAPDVPERLYRVGERAWFGMDRGARIEFDEPGEEGYEDAYLVLGPTRTYASRILDSTLQPTELLGAGAIDEAVTAYRALAEADPAEPLAEAGRLTGLAQQLLDSGRAPAAIALAQLATERDPAAPAAWNVLGRACFVAGDRAASARAYAAALERAEAESTADKDARAFARASASAGLAAARGDAPGK